MANRTVYTSKLDVSVEGSLISGVREITLPDEIGYSHEEDMQGGGVVQKTSGERVMKITYGIPKHGGEYDWTNVVNSTISVFWESGAIDTYINCYWKSQGQPKADGKGAMSRTIEVLVGDKSCR